MSEDSQVLTFRLMTILDLFNFNNVNLDLYTENFKPDFYFEYLIKWPELCIVAEAPDGTIAGYVIGKVEGENLDWHGHVTALSVSPEFRGAGIASQLMQMLESISDRFNCYFVDLFVRSTNHVAIAFYKKIGYSVYRVVPRYYPNDENALDMRKCCSRDAEKKSSLIPPQRR